MKWRLLTRIVTATSLLLFLAFAGFWVRSEFYEDRFDWNVTNFDDEEGLNQKKIRHAPVLVADRPRLNLARGLAVQKRP